MNYNHEKNPFCYACRIDFDWHKLQQTEIQFG